MAGNKYIANSSGKLKEVAAIQSSTGAPDADKIPALNSSGVFDISFMPPGVGAEVVIAASSENLVAGNFVNLHNNGGTINVRKADATTNAKPADGFVLANVTSPANATVYLISAQNTAVSGLTVGADYWLSTTAGAVTATAPSTAGNIVQRLGKAKSATELVFENQDYYELA
jgi:hypothetical protein